MKKRLIPFTGLIILIALLLGAAAAARAENPQPSKSAAQWESEGYQVIHLRDNFFGPDAGTVSGFFVLRDDINYLKADTGNGIPANGNSFSLGELRTIQAGSGDNASMYCVQAGEKFYFGVRDNQSDSTRLVLKDMISLYEHPYSMDVTPYTLGAWVDWQVPFEVDLSDVLPFYGQGYYQVYLDHKSVDPGWTEPTHHTIEYYQAIHFDKIGVKTNEPTDDEFTVGIVKPGGLNLVMLNLTLDDYVGNLEWEAEALQGIEIAFDSYLGVFFNLTAIPHPKNGVTIDGLVVGGVKGDLSLALAAGFKAGNKLILIDNVELDVDLFALDLSGFKGGGELYENTRWHICYPGDCFDESLTLRMGPIRGIIDWTGLDPQTVFESPSVDLGEIYHFYNSYTYNDCHEGRCPHWAWYTKVLVQSLEDSSPLQNVGVWYEEVPEHCYDYTYGFTGADGKVDLYMPAGSYDIKASLTSPLDPDWTIKGQTSLEKEREKTDTVTISLDIPMSRVSFKNPATGEPTDWPEDISFSPFYTENVQIPDTVPGLSGRVFTGWNTEEDGSGTSYAPGARLTLSDDLTLWAQWQIAGDDWYVVYDANGGTKAPDPQIVRKGQDAVLSTELPENGTLIFKGWTPDLMEMDPVLQPGDTLPYDSQKDTVVLHAIWNLSPIPQPIHISFKLNGLHEAVLPPDIWCETGSWLQLEPAEVPFGSSWTFVGWSENPQAKTPEFLAGHSYYFYRSTELYAIWRKQEKLTLTFRDPLPGSASGIPAPISIIPSMSRDVLIPSQIPEKSGRVFTGWNTKEDGTGTSYAPGSVITLEQDVTLWAQWKLAGESWYVIYNANGGTWAPSPQIVPLGQDAVLSSDPPQSGSLLFKGWALNPNAAAPEYMPGDTLPYDSGKNVVVLYALWDLSPAPRPVCVSFDANGVPGAGLPADIWMERNSWLQLPLAVAPLGSARAFRGWSENPDAETPEYLAGHSYCFDQDTRLYAIWNSLDSVTLSFRDPLPGAVSGMPAPISILPSMSRDVLIPSQIPEKSGRVFTGWNTKEDGTGTSYAPGAKLTLSDDLILWAQWKLAGESWYVVYDANGGTKAPGPQIIQKGEDAVLSTELPENGTLIFKGWTPDLRVMDPVFQPGDTLPYDSQKDYVVLHAIWNLSPVPQPIHISFKLNGLHEAVLPPDIWSERGTWLQLKPAKVPLGSVWTFVGWSENPQAKTPEFLAGHSYYFYRSTELYAIWDKQETLTLTFRDPLPDASSGIPAPISIIPSMSRDVQIPDGIPEKSGRIFTGWNTAPDGSGTSYAPGTKLTLSNDLTLWAQWQIAGDDWYVIYNANGGTKAPGPQIIRKGQDAVLTTELPEGGELIFMGWAPDPQHPEMVYLPGNKLKYDSGKAYVVLYALWTLDPAQRPVIISFDANGGLPDTLPEKMSAPKNAFVRLPAQQPSWDAQHDFLGWSGDSKAAEPELKPGEMALFKQDTVLYAVWYPHYRVIEGAGSVWTKGSGKTQRFVADGNLEYFRELRVDGRPFMEGVQISSGSTIADISAKAMESLSIGKHTITFVYVDGEASAPFTVRKKLPPTGDKALPWLWGSLILLGIIGLGFTGRTIRLKRRK